MIETAKQKAIHKHCRWVYLLVLGLFHFHLSSAQAPKDFTLPVQTNIQQQPPAIQFSWTAIPTATAFYLGRKSLTDTSFTLIDSIKSNTATASQFVDQSIHIGIPYEYHIRALLSGPEPTSRNIYLVTGLDITPELDKGRILLLVDSTIMDSLRPDLQQFHQQLVSEGWKVSYETALRSNNPTDVVWVKRKILQRWNQHHDLNTVFIIGHIPVPYAGRINPDGHPDHLGAWPADGYYGDMDSTWKDDTINVVSAARLENRNIPGDGKFDESQLYTNKLAIGRIDFVNLPVLGSSEINLYRRYFQKNSSFRRGMESIRERALISDNLLGFAEKFSQGAWKSFSACIDQDSINNQAPYIGMTTPENSYLFSYGAGAGTYTSANNVANSSDFSSISHHTIFTQIIGSYSGDWDTPNNLLRSSIGGVGKILTCHWGGRPQHFLHHLAIGKTIGYSTLITMNNKGAYFPTGFSLGRVHQALLGDPSLQAKYLKPQPKPTLQTLAGLRVQLTWPRHPAEHIERYYIFRAPSLLDSFSLVQSIPASDTSFIDHQPSLGNNVYLIRAARRDTILRTGLTLNHGRFWHLSPGGIDSITLTSIPIPVQLTSIRAQRQATCVDLVSWEVGDESSIAYYELTASSNGQQFYSLHPPARVLAKNQPGSSYRITTPVGTQPPTTYRLRIVNQAQEPRYSMMAAVTQPDACRSTPLIRYQNHALYWENLPTANGTLSIFSSTGQRLYSSPIQQSRGNLVLPIHRFSGWCHVRIDANDAASVHQRIWIDK